MENENYFDPHYMRINHLKDNIEKDLDLIKEYENELRLADDPKRKKRCEKEINDLKTSLRNYSTEYSLLIKDLPNEDLNFEKAISEFNIVKSKLDSILTGQEKLSRSLIDIKNEILGYFNQTEQKIINELIQNIRQDQTESVKQLLANLEKIEVANLGINEGLDSLQNILQKIERNSKVSIPHKEEISKIFNDPQFNSKQRLKFMIPIIPFLLQYEQETELFLGLNLQELWNRLTDMFRK